LATAGEFRIGRASDNDLVVSSGHVSSHHARLIKTPHGLEIEDLGSTNHTYVDGYQVHRSSVSVGDSVQLSAHYELNWNDPRLQQWLRGGVQQAPKPAPYRPRQQDVQQYQPHPPHQMQHAQPVRAELVSEPLESKSPQKRSGGIPDRCPNCGSTSIKTVAMHKDSKKVKGNGCSGCNSCLLIIIILILAPGILIVFGLGAAIGLAGLTVVISENKELFIAGAVVALTIGIIVSVNQSKTYICEKCGHKFK